MNPLRFISALVVAAIPLGVVTAATPKEIDAAVQQGASYLKDQYKNATTKQVLGGPNGAGAASLSGLALLECGTPASDPSVRVIASAIRDASFSATQTYHIALCILFLDKLGDPSDGPLIQMLGVRLLAGQDANGGWTYECVESVLPLEERDLRRSLFAPDLPAGNKQAAPTPGKNSGSPVGKADSAIKLHPEVEKYQGKLVAVRVRARIVDNSNTQFGILGLWVARKHGIPVETAFDLIEKRFLTTQTSNGGWPYAGTYPSSPSMTCAGLLGLATAIGLKEQRLEADPTKPGPKPTKADPGEKNTAPVKASPPKQTSELRDRAVEKGLSALGNAISGNGRGKGPRMFVSGATLGDHDLYFMWSVERVGVVYGIDKIGGIDWYDVGSEELVAAQNLSGSWGRGGRGAEVDTAFAILFLVRSNPVKDLSNRVQRDAATTTELRTGSGPLPGSGKSANSAAKPVGPVETAESRRPGVIVIRPSTQGDDPKKLGEELAAAMGLEWDTLLTKARDANASVYTQAIVVAIGRLDGDRLKQAREALAERLTRMTAETLRTLAKSEGVELRRAAILAMPMKVDKKHIPDLIDALLDDDEMVVRSARAGLKSLTEQDFGPQIGSTKAECKEAVAAWRAWLAKQKK